MLKTATPKYCELQHLIIGRRCATACSSQMLLRGCGGAPIRRKVLNINHQKHFGMLKLNAPEYRKLPCKVFEVAARSIFFV